MQEPGVLLRALARPRMWMEKRIGKRINTGSGSRKPWTLNPATISTACPYCLVMLGDAVNVKKSSGEARETLEVVDVAPATGPVSQPGSEPGRDSSW